MDWLLVAVFSKLSEKRTEKRIGQISRRNERKRGGVSLQFWKLINTVEIIASYFK